MNQPSGHLAKPWALVRVAALAAHMAILAPSDVVLGVTQYDWHGALKVQVTPQAGVLDACHPALVALS
eukprot:6317297-Alexandrium_andersonii.AAC.1